MLTLLALLTVSAAPQPVRCRPALEITGRSILGPTGADMGQVRVTLTARPGCPTQMVRIRTRNGGIIPPLGYWRIGGGHPLRINYWVMRGASAEWREQPNIWVNIPPEVLK